MLRGWVSGGRDAGREGVPSIGDIEAGGRFHATDILRDVETVETLAGDLLEGWMDGGGEGVQGGSFWMEGGREGGREGGLTFLNHSPAISACCRPKSVRRHLDECRRRNSPGREGGRGGAGGSMDMREEIFPRSDVFNPSLPPSLSYLNRGSDRLPRIGGRPHYPRSVRA